jgi:phage gpG-like protein
MDKFQQVRNQIYQAIESGLEAVGATVAGQAVELTPVDTGRLKGSITWATQQAKDSVRSPAKDEDAVQTRPGKNTVIIGTNVEYGPHVEFGTGKYGPNAAAYEIKPTDKKALFWKGAKHPVTKVMHPGSPAQPYLRRSVELTRDDIPRIFEQSFRENLE